MRRLWKGNYALVEGAIAGGCEAYFGYPITPQNEVTEYMSVRMRELGRVFLQAESELAAINMVFGAALTGKRVMTTSSSPGISLMQEGISYLVGCELPCVVVNVQRGGPGLGNIQGAQGDYFQAVKGGGHGDYKLFVLAPSTVQEMYEMTKKAFNIAFKYRNPVMILTDGVLGQMMEPAEIEESVKCKGQSVREIEDLGWNLTGCKGRVPRFIRSLLMGEGELEDHNYKLQEKFLKMKEDLDYEEEGAEDADVILIGYGLCARINFEVYTTLRKKGLKIGYLRPKTLYPFPERRIRELARRKKKFLVVEMSCGQMVEDVKLSVNGESEVYFYGRPGGGVPEVEMIINKIEEIIR
ncbi:MAG: 3-methyl-2-oxobutanoate dehydrogenase subunit beta [Caldiserica bacterium]|nr:MAG: 3-methyl-2-oxobutanoate dehydrogenase subunit beta [Caldisericota bacterium]